MVDNFARPIGCQNYAVTEQGKVLFFGDNMVDIMARLAQEKGFATLNVDY
jgi:hypothetical protein